MTATIKLNDSAFFSLLLEGLEAYAVKHHGKKQVAIETHAQLWGRVNQRLPFNCEVKHISVDSSAKKTRGSVQTDLLSLTLKKDVAAMFGDDYLHVGTFHTHPWILEEKYGIGKIENANSIRRDKLYNFSKDDHLCECDNPTINVGKHQFSVALVMTIFSASKADDRKDGWIQNDLCEFSLGNVKIWIKAQVYQHLPKEKLTDEYEESLNKYNLLEHVKFSNSNFETLPVPVETQLVTPFLDDIDYYLQKFGRLDIVDSNGHYRNAESAEGRWLYK